MADSFIERMRASSHLSGSSVVYVESMYEQYLTDPGSVPTEWQDYFKELPEQDHGQEDVPHRTILDHFERLGRNRFKAQPERESQAFLSEHEYKQVKVLELINSYRAKGHKQADLDPLDNWQRPTVPELELGYHQLSIADFDTVYSTGSSSFFDKNAARLREIVGALQETYCGTIGAEYSYLDDDQEELWLRHRLESNRSNPDFSEAKKLEIFDRISAAEGLERYLQLRYPGTKRFGLEGGESLIPMLHDSIQRLGDSYDVVEVVLAMAHRGRLNVLVNILGKSTGELFDEFEGNVLHEGEYSGDVKYHQGFSSNITTGEGELHLALSFNPSHLEIVSPVAIGSVRARQDRRNDPAGSLVAPIVIHGDAAFAGQGVVMETFQMSQTRGFKTGGTIHIILNNQIGFTTSAQEDARSTDYCSDIAKMINAPVLHVNGDDPEAAVFAAQCAVDYRSLFGKDIVIDLVCYRRRGHNETEDPSKTQPLMYEQIANHPTTAQIYRDQLIGEKVINSAEADEIANDLRDRLDRGEMIAKSITKNPNTSLFVDWRPYLDHEWTAPADTRLKHADIQELNQKMSEIPQGFVLHKQVQRTLDDRTKMAAGVMPINWGFAETMAYASLLAEGYPVRLTGQDVGVGTFSHRYAALFCQKTGDRYIPLEHISDSSRFSIYDSYLSEEAVLAYEYGYATTAPSTLSIWEAQFGDFVNGAQVVIDQFVSSGEAKWLRMCGLTMLLPHGYEGAGPEHSSARLERFMQLCAQKNMQVCVPTTPAQMFHLLRRQVIRPMRRPLIVMTPKSLLRHKSAVSRIEDLTEGKFQPVLVDIEDYDYAAVERLVVCNGKVYYDLLKAQEEQGVENTAILRIEQLYPFPHDELDTELKRYTNLKSVVWCQEEPRNQGAWFASRHHLDNALDEYHPHIELQYAGRRDFAAPAGGSMRRHTRHQEALVAEALSA